MPPYSFLKNFMGLVLAAAVIGFGGLSATSVRAHAVVKVEMFDESKLVPGQAATITLHFNVAIHVPFAQVFLLETTGKEGQLATRAGDAANRLIVDIPALAPGSYALRYRVLAADGHYTDNALRFQIRPRP